MSNITIELTLVSEICCNCGVVFGFEKTHRQRMLDTGEYFYCPNGHPQHFTESTISKLKKRLASRDEDVSYWIARAENEGRSHAATKGHLTRAKKRIGNGVCPCCNRHFTNLERHMNTMHPDYKNAIG